MRAVIRGTAIVGMLVVILLIASGSIRLSQAFLGRWPAACQRDDPGAGNERAGCQPAAQGIEEAREDKGKKGSESGDPPDA